MPGGLYNRIRTGQPHLSAEILSGPNLTADASAARDLHFLAGGGEMSQLMRVNDWSTTPLGAPEHWPQSLRATVSLMLNSKYPMFLAWGPQLAFLYNDGYRPIFGEKHPYALGRPFAEIWREIWDDVRPLVDRALAGEATWSEDLQLFMHRRGFPEEVYFTFSYSPVYDERGEVAGMFCACTETTERVLGERRLKVLRDLAARSNGTESVEEVYRWTAEVLREATLDVPFALFYEEAEPGVARLAFASGGCSSLTAPERIDLQVTPNGWPIAKTLTANVPWLIDDVPTRVGAVVCDPWPESVRQAYVLPVSASAPHQPMGCLIVGLSTRREFDEHYRDFLTLVAGQLAAAIDKARTLENERRRAAALAEIDRAKTLFFSNVSHEFRTPLTLMLGPIEEALANPKLAPADRDRLTLAHRNALRLLKLVNSLLDFSRIEAGRVRASYEPTDLGALTQDLASTFRSAIERAGLTFRVHCTLDQLVHVDPEMWEKIVLNLLSNAFKFTLAGNIEVRLYRDGATAVLEVADSGVGVGAAEIPRLFDRFYRVEGAGGRTQEGSGIGLALVQELVRLHGGEIDVRSELGCGTQFRVRLPLGTAHLPLSHDSAAAGRVSTAVSARMFVQEALRWLPEAPTDTSMRLTTLSLAAPDADRRFASTFGARVVLADDNADMRAYLRDLLARFYAVECCANGAEALEAAKREPPDLILSDVMMPQLDGFGLLAAVRAEPGLQETPVLLLSARAGEESRIEGLDAGADDYVVKPFSARELLARIGALLERSRMHREALRTEQSLSHAFRMRTEQFETLFNAAPIGIYLIDADFRLREVNPTARPVFAHVPQLIGRDFDEVLYILFPPDVAQRLSKMFRHTLQTGEPCGVDEFIEHRIDVADTAYYEWRIVRIPLPEGRHGVVCCFRDISAYVKTRDALLRQKHQLQVADQQKDQFLAMLAHELRNPLAPIRNASEVLTRIGSPEPRAHAAAELIQRQVVQLTRLVDDLLDVSRITQGRIELKSGPVELAHVISQALETVDSLLRERRHVVTVSAGVERLFVRGDAVRLVQCLVNLLTNAAKYTDAAGEISVRSWGDASTAYIEVKDCGVGIPAALLPRVFDLFVQSDRTLDRAQGGLGIGLSVVKRLIEMHGGHVSAASDGVGAGSTFRIELPRIEPAASQPRHALDEHSLTQRRILIVDDNQDAASSLAVLLEMEGHEVRVAYSPAQALQMLEQFTPTTALLDIGLPEMDGYELAQRVREKLSAKSVRLIALTGYGQPEDRQRALDAGFDGHAVKPIDLSTLQRMMNG